MQTKLTYSPQQFGNQGSYWALILLAIILQSGCSTIDKSPEPVSIIDTPTNWKATESKLRELKNWTLIGKIGIKTPDETVTAAINQWKQTSDNFVIDLSSTFFGLGASKLYGSANFLTITESGEEPVSSYEPDVLIQQALGFPLPISSLSWWVKGIPTPDNPHDIRFNAQGHIAQLTQDQWKLTYSKYKIIDGLSLPGKIKLERNNVRIILAIKQWTQL